MIFGSSLLKTAQKTISSYINPPKVSIVIAFRGSEADLCRALYALSLQTYRSFEIVLVIDGVRITKKIFQSLGDIKVEYAILYNKTQRGPLFSRIKGAEKASGKYLWFMDHDDTVDEDFLEIMVQAGEKNSTEIVECPILKVFGSGDKLLFHRFDDDEILYGEQIIRAFMNGKSHNNLWNKLILRKLWVVAIREIRIDHTNPIIFFDDMLCTMLVYNRAKSYRCLFDACYHYKCRPDSTINTRDPDTVAMSICGLEKVLLSLEPLLNKYANTAELCNFRKREIEWALDHLSHQAESELPLVARQTLERLRLLYLPRT